jgi:hypothetical protein
MVGADRAARIVLIGDGKEPEMKKAWLPGALAGALILGGCVMEQQQGCTCTMEYRYFPVVVADASGGVDSAVVHTYRVSDGKELKRDTTSWPGRPKGSVVVFSDGNTNDFPKGMDKMEVRVTASKGGKSGEERYVFTTTDCRCHFDKLSGKDTLLIQ